MANDSVNIPVSLEITDISMGNVDLNDVEQNLRQRVSGIVKSVENIMSNADTSKFNKALASSFSSMEKSYARVQAAQAKFSEAMRKAGESSEAYKAKLSEVKSEIKTVQDSWNTYNDFMGQSYAEAKKAETTGNLKSHQASIIKMYEEELAKYEQQMQEVQAKMPNPMDFVSSGSESAITKVSQSYKDLLKAITDVDNAQKDWNQTMKDNNATDEYQKMAQEIQKAEEQLAKLQAKAAKMEALGASDKQWETLIYDANLLSQSITENEAKMRKLVRTGQAFRFGKGGSAIGQEYMKLTGVLTRVQKSMSKINSMKPNTMYTEDYAKQVKELEALEHKLMSYKEKYQKMQTMGATSNQWKAFTVDATILEGKITEIISSLQEMINTGKAFKLGTGDSAKELDSLSARLSQANSSMSEMQSSSKNTKVNLSSLTKTVTSFCNSVSKGFSKVISMFKQLGKTNSQTSTKMNKSLKKILRNVLMLGFGVRSLFFFVKRLRTIFIDSFKEMATQIPEVNDQISSFVTALNQLKGTISTAFQPIVSLAIPAVNALSDALTNAMITMGKFFATLTGQDYIYKFTADQVDYAESLRGTSSAAKKAQKSLMGFDEINRLNGNEDSSSGDSTGVLEKETLSGMSSLAELIKQAWSESDFTEVGRYIGEKLLSALETANVWITTKGFAYADKIALSVATLINGALDTKELGDGLGEVVANGLNLVMTGLNKFLTTTSWTDIGQFLADFVMKSIETFEWELLGETMGNIVSAAISTWYNFVGEDGIDFTMLGTKISNGINTLFSTLNAVDENGLTGWQKLGTAISNSIEGIIETITVALDGLEWDKVGESVGTLISNIEWRAVAWNFAKLVGAFVNGLGQAFLEWTATEPISAGIVAMVVSAFAGIKLAPLFANLVTFGGKIAEVIALTVGGTGTLKEAVAYAFGPSFGLFAGIGMVVVGVITAFTNFFSMLKNGFNWLKEILMVIGIALTAVGAVILGAPAAVAAVVAGIVAAVATLVVLIVEHWESIWAFLQSAWTVLSQTVIAVLQGIFSVIAGILGAIVSAITAVVGVIASIIATIIGVITTAVATVVGIITTVVTTIVNIFKGIILTTKTILDTIFKTVYAIITGNFSSLKTIFTDALTSLDNIWNNVWGTIASVTKSIWDGISNTIKGTVNGIIGFINGMISGVVSGINTVIGVLNKLHIDIPDWVPELGGQTFGFNLGTITAPQIPKLAQGGVIPPNKEFMAILGDQKHGTNIEAPLDTIKQAVDEELADYIDAMMTGFQAVVDAVNNKDLDVRIGDSAIGKAAERYNRRQALLRGTT